MKKKKKNIIRVFMDLLDDDLKSVFEIMDLSEEESFMKSFKNKLLQDCEDSKIDLLYPEIPDSTEIPYKIQFRLAKMGVIYILLIMIKRYVSGKISEKKFNEFFYGEHFEGMKHSLIEMHNLLNELGDLK